MGKRPSWYRDPEDTDARRGLVAQIRALGHRAMTDAALELVTQLQFDQEIPDDLAPHETLAPPERAGTVRPLRAAVEVACHAVRFLAGAPEATDSDMLEMFAGLYRTRTDDLNGFAIREAASAVCGALDPVVYLNDVRRVYSLEEKAALLRASLASVGPEFADLDPAFLVDLLRRYTPKKPASGRLTAAGIVAELLIKTGAMGASRSDSTVNRQRVLDRVTKAIRARRRA